jgi:hypothetical protein
MIGRIEFFLSGVEKAFDPPVRPLVPTFVSKTSYKKNLVEVLGIFDLAHEGERERQPS